jgi:hypothetical protein
MYTYIFVILNWFVGYSFPCIVKFLAHSYYLLAYCTKTPIVVIKPNQRIQVLILHVYACNSMMSLYIKLEQLGSH